MRFVILIFFIAFTACANAQRVQKRIFYKRDLANTTWHLTEYKTYLNEHQSYKVEKKSIQFFKDSVVVFLDSSKQIGTWATDNFAFNMQSQNANWVTYDWVFGWEDEVCFLVNGNRKKVECYKKVKK